MVNALLTPYTNGKGRNRQVCAESCDQFRGDRAMAECASICRRCAECCRQMASAVV